jgi:hypothetical protein
MRKLTPRVLASVVVAAIACLPACSSRSRAAGVGSNAGTGDPASHDDTGSVAIQFTLPGGSHVNSVGYSLTNNVNTYGGTVDVSASSAISFVIAGVSAGSGYQITLSVISSDGPARCDGSYGTGISDAGQNNGAPFTVVNRQSTLVTVQMLCVDPDNSNQGSVLVNGLSNCCPTWDTAVANPSGLCNTAPHNTATLTGNASAPCDGDSGAGSNLSCTWSIKSGAGVAGATAMDNRGNFVATFTCPVVGEQDVVQLDCVDGTLPSGGFCPANLTHAEVAISCGSCSPCTIAGESGVVASPDTASGACTGTDPATGKPLVNSGIADALGDYCCVPAP